MGALHEGADVRAIVVPEMQWSSYAGFIEIFSWEGCIALESLYVFPRFRRQGIGRGVVRALESMCDDNLTIWSSRPSQSFYELLGYKQDKSQGGLMMLKRPNPGKTFTQAASQLWN